jgi:hypothetical protein
MKSPKSQERERRHLQAAKQFFWSELNTRFLSHSRWREMKYLNDGEIGRGNCSLECCQNCQPLHHPQSRHIYDNKRGEKKDLLQTATSHKRNSKFVIISVCWVFAAARKWVLQKNNRSYRRAAITIIHEFITRIRAS